MATQAIEQVSDDDAAEAAPAPAPGKRNLIILAVAGLVAGAAAGLFGIGPILAKKRASTPVAEKPAESNEAAVNHSIENIVLNPAGTNGQRFLMVTAAFQLKDASIDGLMKEHEAEIRDHMLALLSKKTVEELTDPTMRDPIKKEVLDAVAPLFPKGSVLKVLFTQFVVQ